MATSEQYKALENIDSIEEDVADQNEFRAILKQKIDRLRREKLAHDFRVLDRGL